MASRGHVGSGEERWPVGARVQPEDSPCSIFRKELRSAGGRGLEVAVSSGRPRPEESPLRKESGDVRCCCGSLLARVVEGGIEVKCRRCKRVVFVAFGVAALADERGPPTGERNSG